MLTNLSILKKMYWNKLSFKKKPKISLKGIYPIYVDDSIKTIRHANYVNTLLATLLLSFYAVITFLGINYYIMVVVNVGVIILSYYYSLKNFYFASTIYAISIFIMLNANLLLTDTINVVDIYVNLVIFFALGTFITLSNSYKYGLIYYPLGIVMPAVDYMLEEYNIFVGHTIVPFHETAMYFLMITLLIVATTIIISNIFLLEKNSKKYLAEKKMNDAMQNSIKNYTLKLKETIIKETENLYVTNKKLNHKNDSLRKTIKILQILQDRISAHEKKSSIALSSASISHEINNPLNYIKNSLAILMENVYELNEDDNEDKDKLNELFSYIEQGIQKIENIIREFSLSMKESTSKECIDIQKEMDFSINLLYPDISPKMHIIRKYQAEKSAIHVNKFNFIQMIVILIKKATQYYQGLEKNIEIITEKNPNNKELKIEILTTLQKQITKTSKKEELQFILEKKKIDGEDIDYFLMNKLKRNIRAKLFFNFKDNREYSISLFIPIHRTL